MMFATIMQHTRSVLRPVLGMALATGLSIGPVPVTAEVPETRLNQTIENPGDVSKEQRQQMLDQSIWQEHAPLLLEGAREGSTAAKDVLAAADIRQFWIYDARTELAGDEDHDGFFYRLRVTFDADVDIGGANVYAMLYLSYEEGPWNHYFTTDVFYILEDSFYDDYEVVTQLLEGYPTGYYDILIELYDADRDVLVATYGPYEDVALDNIPLEDQLRDIPDDDGGGGGIGWLGLSLFGAWWGRGVLAGRRRGCHMRRNG
jgi:hypothetical protein